MADRRASALRTRMCGLDRKRRDSPARRRILRANPDAVEAGGYAAGQFEHGFRFSRDILSIEDEKIAAVQRSTMHDRQHPAFAFGRIFCARHEYGLSHRIANGEPAREDQDEANEAR